MANAQLKQLLNDLREAERDARQSDYRAVRNAISSLIYLRVSQRLDLLEHHLLTNILRMRRLPDVYYAARDPKRFRTYYPNGQRALLYRQGRLTALRLAQLRERARAEGLEPPEAHAVRRDVRNTLMWHTEPRNT